jgi:filamentous hemagglutinin family protein
MMMKCIAAAGSISAAIFSAAIAEAQIKPDNTLGADRSQVNNNLIEGGAQRGGNLFHSFSEFSINSGQRIDFANPAGINNIITRVTDAPSNINGTLGVLGSANLFWLNPNGISFGQNARLDMQGVFIGTTANGLKFNDGNIYSTVNPQTPLLTMTTPVGLQFGGRTGNINLTDAVDLLARDTVTKYAGNSILLVGGNITLTGSKLILPNGKIEFATAGDGGTIAIDPTKLTEPKASSLTVPDGVERGDITIQNSSRLNTVGTNSGNVNLFGRNVTISGTNYDTRSVINARSTGTDANAKGGGVNIKATGDVVLSGNFSGISTSPMDAIRGGDISITARNLQVLDGAYIETGPYGAGRGGQISIAVSDTIKLASSTGDESAIQTGSYSTGLSNDINIQTGKLIERDGSQISADPIAEADKLPGVGKQGDINIIAREFVEVSGVSKNVFLLGFPKPTAITSFSAGQSTSGNINIQTPKFTLKDGASISAGTDGSGAGGSVLISGLNGQNAEFVELLGNSNLSQFLGTENLPNFAGVGNGSRIRSIASQTGDAGVVKINADRVTLQAGTRIDVSTLNSSGKGGSIDIQAKNLELIDGGQLISTTKGTGQAGKINVRADRVININGADANFAAKRTFLSFIAFISNTTSAKQTLKDFLKSPNTTAQTSIINGWQEVNNNPADRQILQQYLTLLETNPTARSTLQSFLTKTEGQSSLSDYTIFLNVGENSGIISRSLASASGNGGDISLSAPNLNIQNNAVVTGNGDGSGRGGNISVNAETIKLDRGTITVKTASTNGGDIELYIGKLLSLRNQSEISANAAANGNGGNISLLTPSGLIITVPIENSDITASAVGGSGGRIQIKADNVLGFSTQKLDRLSNIAATSALGAQGVVTITLLGNDPNRGLQPDPIPPSTPTISQTCASNSTQAESTFIDSGKGGMTPSASEPLRNSTLWIDPRQGNAPVSMPAPSVRIEPAQGWQRSTDRTVILTSQPTDYSVQNTRQDARSIAPNCGGR